MIGLAYLNYAGLAPLHPRAAVAGLVPWELAGNAMLPRLIVRQQRLRERVARWLRVSDRNVAYLPSTTAGLQAVAASIDWCPGDVVLYPRGDFPANVFPWTGLARRGAIPMAVDDWDAPFPPQARLVAISTVDYSTGDERPWREVCTRARQLGIWTCVDAIQSAGIKPCRTDDVDFWVAGTQKWLVSGLGLALLVVHDRALEALEGPWQTYLGLRDPRVADSGPADSARRWELGWVTPGALLRFDASFRLLRTIGWEEVSARVGARRDMLYESLLEIGYPVLSSPASWSGIVTIDPAPLDAAALVADGYRRRIVAAERRGNVRLSAHMFTRRAEIGRAIDWLWRARSGAIAVGAR
jgi:cysteine desulfurase/selenocysteine lyase